MEVTKHNFNEVLTELGTILKNASFVSIDGEFTGLNAGEGTHALDTPAEYYKKIRAGALDFLFVQFGLAVFNYDEDTHKYTHRAYNFYIFPRPCLRHAPDSRFLCQASSLDFLAKNNFNFNKLFYEGIPYLSKSEEQKMRDKLEEKRKDYQNFLSSPSSNTQIEVPAEHKTTVANACEKISNFLKNDTLEELVLDNHNAFLRKLIYQEAWKIFSRDDITLETKQYQIVAKKAGTKEEQERLEKEKKEKEDAEIDEAVGFSNLIRLLSESEKLIVGHNMLLDLCHVLHRFCMPLPDNYTDFKDMLHCFFPKLLDTKYLCSYPDIKDKIPSSVLSHILATIGEPPFNRVEVESENEKTGYSLLADKSHEAGYDAFITGVIFITICNYLGTLRNPVGCPVLPTSPILKQFINKLFLMKISDTHMNLDGPDPVVNREHVFHVTFPKEWTYQDLNQLFSPFGNIFITWLSETTAFVSLSNRDNTLAATRSLVRNKKYKNNKVKVLTYHMFNSVPEKSPTNSSLFTNQSPSISMTRKRKVPDSQVESPKRKRSLSFERRRMSGPKLSIESIPEEDETLLEDKSPNEKQKSNAPDICVKKEKEPEIGNGAKFIEENEDWS